MKSKNLGILISLWKTYEMAQRANVLEKKNQELQRENNRLNQFIPNPCREIDIYGNDLDRFAKEMQKYQSKIIYTTATTGTRAFPPNININRM